VASRSKKAKLFRDLACSETKSVLKKNNLCLKGASIPIKRRNSFEIPTKQDKMYK
jgi:hypothetical protein